MKKKIWQLIRAKIKNKSTQLCRQRHNSTSDQTNWAEFQRDNSSALLWDTDLCLSLCLIDSVAHFVSQTINMINPMLNLLICFTTSNAKRRSSKSSLQSTHRSLTYIRQSRSIQNHLQKLITTLKAKVDSSCTVSSAYSYDFARCWCMFSLAI